MAVPNPVEHATLPDSIWEARLTKKATRKTSSAAPRHDDEFRRRKLPQSRRHARTQHCNVRWLFRSEMPPPATRGKVGRSRAPDHHAATGDRGRCAFVWSRSDTRLPASAKGKGGEEEELRTTMLQPAIADAARRRDRPGIADMWSLRRGASATTPRRDRPTRTTYIPQLRMRDECNHVSQGTSRNSPQPPRLNMEGKARRAGIGGARPTSPGAQKADTEVARKA